MTGVGWREWRQRLLLTRLLSSLSLLLLLLLVTWRRGRLMLLHRHDHGDAGAQVVMMMARGTTEEARSDGAAPRVLSSFLS